jgi:hypothetical protein
LNRVPRAAEDFYRTGLAGSTGNTFINWLLLLVLLLSLIPRAESAEWVPVTGKVMFGDTPLCAMVLANGQNMFSCSGDGSFNLSVPLGNNGQITLFTFATGFAPFKQVMSPSETAYFTVNMKREAEGRSLSIDHNVTASTRTGWVVVDGSIDFNGTPVCALMLANGQHMFSCNASLGKYSLEVPADNSGNITLHAFVSGFQPFKDVFPSSVVSNNILGEYAGSYTIDVDNCSDPEMNGTYNFSVNISIVTQSETSFSGTAIGTNYDFGTPVSEYITLSGTISATGAISGKTSHAFLATGGIGTFSGQLSGDALSIVNSGHDTYGDICTYTRNITAVR